MILICDPEYDHAVALPCAEMCHLSIGLVDSIITSNRVEITAFESRICPALTTISSPNADISHVHLSLSLCPPRSPYGCCRYDVASTAEAACIYLAMMVIISAI